MKRLPFKPRPDTIVPATKPVPVNRRRKSRFVLVRPRHLMPVLAGALCATLVLHLLGFTVLSWIGISLRLSPSADPPPEEDRIAVIVTDEEDPVTPVLPPEVPPSEIIPAEKIELDVEDLPIEEITIAPGETEINLDNREEAAGFAPSIDEAALQTMKEGLGDPVFSETLSFTDNPVKIASLKQPEDFDPDRIYSDLVKGAGGSDDSTLPGGSKTLGELLKMAPGTLGKGAGYSRLGADLLFEYNKAVLKNSARIGLLQLAALMYKNPETVFIIEGHTDSFGTKEYNALLSLMRANAVREWLKDNGIDLSRVYIRACGDSRPVVSTDGDRDRQAANRRVEIHMRKKGEDIPSDALPHTFHVDMATPIARQLSSGTTLPPSQPPPVEKAPEPSAPPIPVAEPVNEDIPVAEPVEEPVTVARPSGTSPTYAA